MLVSLEIILLVSFSLEKKYDSFDDEIKHESDHVPEVIKDMALKIILQGKHYYYDYFDLELCIFADENNLYNNCEINVYCYKELKACTKEFFKSIFKGDMFPAYECVETISKKQWCYGYYEREDYPVELYQDSFDDKKTCKKYSLIGPGIYFFEDCVEKRGKWRSTVIHFPTIERNTNILLDKYGGKLIKKRDWVTKLWFSVYLSGDFLKILDLEVKYVDTKKYDYSHWPKYRPLSSLVDKKKEKLLNRRHLDRPADYKGILMDEAYNDYYPIWQKNKKKHTTFKDRVETYIFPASFSLIKDKRKEDSMEEIDWSDLYKDLKTCYDTKDICRREMFNSYVLLNKKLPASICVNAYSDKWCFIERDKEEVFYLSSFKVKPAIDYEEIPKNIRKHCFLTQENCKLYMCADLMLFENMPSECIKTKYPYKNSNGDEVKYCYFEHTDEKHGDMNIL